MTYSYRILGLATVASLCLTSPAQADDRHKHHDNDDETAAAIVGGVALVGLAAALASKKNKHRDREWNRYQRNNNHYYRHNWGDVYYVGRNDDIPCYRSQRRCYKNGRYSSEWTHKEFGYDPYPRGRNYYRGR